MKKPIDKHLANFLLANHINYKKDVPDWFYRKLKSFRITEKHYIFKPIEPYTDEHYDYYLTDKGKECICKLIMFIK